MQPDTYYTAEQNALIEHLESIVHAGDEEYPIVIERDFIPDEGHVDIPNREAWRYTTEVYSHEGHLLVVLDGHYQMLSDIEEVTTGNAVDIGKMIRMLLVGFGYVLRVAYRYELYGYFDNKTLTEVYYHPPHDSDAREQVQWGQ